MDETEKTIKLNRRSSRFEAQMPIITQACTVLDIAHDMWTKEKFGCWGERGCWQSIGLAMKVSNLPDFE